MSISENAGLNPDALARLDASIQSDIDKGVNFGASILLARGGVIGHRATFGTVAPDRAPADDDRYLMMSLSKSFTAALILRSIDRGQLTLDTRAADIIPAFGTGGKQRVTIRMLLTHTAGTFNGMAPAGFLPGDLGNLAKYVAAISTVPAMNVPGDRVVYNTAASYAVLGQILVETDPARRSFSDIAREDLFLPLGMADTVFGLGQDDPRRVPVSYTAKYTTPATSQMLVGMNAGFVAGAEIPAGSAFAPIDDVLRFTEAYRLRGAANGYRLMSPAIFDYARQNHTGDMSNGAWDFWREAHGLEDFPANFTLMGGYVRGSGHYLNGMGFTASPQTFCAIGGGSTLWMIDPDRDLTFIFLSAGFVDGLAHLDRLRRLGDLAIAACP